MQLSNNCICMWWLSDYIFIWWLMSAQALLLLNLWSGWSKNEGRCNTSSIHTQNKINSTILFPIITYYIPISINFISLPLTVLVFFAKSSKDTSWYHCSLFLKIVYFRREVGNCWHALKPVNNNNLNINWGLGGKLENA